MGPLFSSLHEQAGPCYAPRQAGPEPALPSPRLAMPRPAEIGPASPLPRTGPATTRLRLALLCTSPCLSLPHQSQPAAPRLHPAGPCHALPRTAWNCADEPSQRPATPYPAEYRRAISRTSPCLAEPGRSKPCRTWPRTPSSAEPCRTVPRPTTPSHNLPGQSPFTMPVHVTHLAEPVHNAPRQAVPCPAATRQRRSRASLALSRRP